jgi:predicted nucleic-acid-binding protein
VIALDTNVLVRYITQDDADQAAAAPHIIEGRCTPGNPGWIALVVMCELVWVLTRAYRYEKAAIADLLDAILSAADLRVEHEDIAGAALQAWRTGGADFADCVIVESARAGEALPLVTFDRRLAEHTGAVLVSDLKGS